MIKNTNLLKVLFYLALSAFNYSIVAKGEREVADEVDKLDAFIKDKFSKIGQYQFDIISFTKLNEHDAKACRDLCKILKRLKIAIFACDFKELWSAETLRYLYRAMCDLSNLVECKFRFDMHILAQTGYRCFYGQLSNQKCDEIVQILCVIAIDLFNNIGWNLKNYLSVVDSRIVCDGLVRRRNYC